MGIFNYPRYIIEGEAQRVFRMCVLRVIMLEKNTDISRVRWHATVYGYHLGTLMYWQRSMKRLWNGNNEGRIRDDVQAEARRIYNLIEAEAKEPQ